VSNRQSKLYDALETDKLTLDDLAPRIRELRVREDELSKTSLQLAVENFPRRIKPVDADTVKSYAEDLNNLPGEADTILRGRRGRAQTRLPLLNPDPGLAGRRPARCSSRRSSSLAISRSQS